VPQRLILALVTLVVSGWPTLSEGYVRSTTSKSGSPLGWLGSNCIYIRVNSSGSDDIKDGSDIAAAKSSIQTWRNAIRSCSYLRFVLEADSATALPGFTKSGANENVIYWVESGWKHEKMAAAITTVYFLEKQGSSQDGRILDADIELNGEFFHFSTKGNPLRTDIENTVTHEMGHMMGLDHPCDDGTRQPVPKDHTGETIPKCSAVQASNDPKSVEIRESTMYNFADPGETKKRTPEPFDIQGICEVYPIKDDPGECFPVSYDGGDNGCNVSSASPPLGTLGTLMWLVLLGLLLVVRPGVKGSRRRPSPPDRSS
jgi:MYXO-CTERM domain-containing protein